jgi:1-acyl-sn-glycerol-3-phosphate acyltransferase
VRAFLIIILLIINMVFTSLWVIFSFLLIHLLPKYEWRQKGKAWMQHIPVWWMDVNYWILQLSTRNKWYFEGDTPLNPQGWYLLICNHQSWMDILVLGIFFRHKIPNLKFFMKKELLWSLPFASWATYVLGYPFMARHSHEEIRKNPHLKMVDIETTRQACSLFKEFPTTVVNFVEGTRFTAKKRDSQQSPYQHLLKPKSTGVALVLQELHQQLGGIINVTLCYEPQNLSFWEFLQGKITKIYLHYELLPIQADLVGDPYEDRMFRKHFQQWLNSVWQIKDQQINRMSS